MGFINKTLKRVRTGDTRMEEKTPFDIYMKNIEWVDLGCPDTLFARLDYPLDFQNEEHEKLSLEDIDEIVANLPEDIKIINTNLIYWLKNNCDTMACFDKGHKMSHVVCKSKTDKTQSIYFNYDKNKDGKNPYFNTRLSGKNYAIVTHNIGSSPISYLGSPSQRVTFDYTGKLYTIKLVKVKNQ